VTAVIFRQGADFSDINLKVSFTVNTIIYVMTLIDRIYESQAVVRAKMRHKSKM
jgi:hypothetical protein